MKWILWLPHGLLHESRRGGKNGARQYRDMARRFTLWRTRDMEQLIKGWRQAAAKGQARISKAMARKAKGEEARIARSIRLLRKGAISTAGKAL